MFYELKTERLIIRSLTTADAAAMHAYRSKVEVARFQSWHPQSLEQVNELIRALKPENFNATGEWYQVGITLKENQKLIGDLGIQINSTDSRLAEIGITIHPQYQNKAYGKEALSALLNLLLNKLGKHRVTASVDPRNLASMALMQRVGLRQEGHFVKSLWIKDTWVDDVIFAALKNDWPNSTFL
ncbi:GNAT family N-acetyltransferase [bacterium]|nr:GNAT family N-acetyltransferase [bacterium]MBP9808541.1 GNAT family N-acetyltransferase [bacterium]